MKLMNAYPGLEIERRNRALIVQLSAPHTVLSSCPVNGGLRDDLSAIVNHQCCEPRGHFPSALETAVQDPAAYLDEFCRSNRLPRKCALLSTAVDINNAGEAHRSFRGLEVISLCTAGIESNAACAGDPAQVYEAGGRFLPIGEAETPAAGTINLIVCINRRLAPAAMVTAVLTATEAKTAVMMALNIGSRYSDSLATGTGTDQIALAACLGKQRPLTGAGKHTKLGELVACTVTASLKEALSLQNRLTARSRCSSLILLERFGANRERLMADIAAGLSPSAAELLARNFKVFERDPLAAAAVSAMVHLHEAFRIGTLPVTCRADIFSMAGAQLAVMICGRPDLMNAFREHLPAAELDGSNGTFITFVCRCMATGFARKWER